MLKRQAEFIEEEDFEQILSYDFQKDRADMLESKLCLAKVELEIAQKMENFWNEAYEELNKEFMKYLETR